MRKTVGGVKGVMWAEFKCEIATGWVQLIRRKPHLSPRAGRGRRVAPGEGAFLRERRPCYQNHDCQVAAIIANSIRKSRKPRCRCRRPSPGWRADARNPTSPRKRGEVTRNVAA
jgi:hypothetical protein